MLLEAIPKDLSKPWEDPLAGWCSLPSATCWRWWCCLCCAVLCCAVLCCAVLCCAVLCCAVLCCAVLLQVVLLEASHSLQAGPSLLVPPVGFDARQHGADTHQQPLQSPRCLVLPSPFPCVPRCKRARARSGAARHWRGRAGGARVEAAGGWVDAQLGWVGASGARAPLPRCARCSPAAAHGLRARLALTCPLHTKQPNAEHPKSTVCSPASRTRFQTPHAGPGQGPHLWHPRQPVHQGPAREPAHLQAEGAADTGHPRQPGGSGGGPGGTRSWGQGPGGVLIGVQVGVRVGPGGSRSAGRSLRLRLRVVGPAAAPTHAVPRGRCGAYPPGVLRSVTSPDRCWW